MQVGGGIHGLGPFFFNVTLAQQPQSAVSVAVGLSNWTRGDISPPQLSFTPDNWSLPQQVGLASMRVAALDPPYCKFLQAALCMGQQLHRQ